MSKVINIGESILTSMILTIGILLYTILTFSNTDIKVVENVNTPMIIIVFIMITITVSTLKAKLEKK